MARTPSNMIPLGTIAPEFYLKDTNSNHTYLFEDLKGSKGTLVIFMCNHCPFVLHVINEIEEVAKAYDAACTPDFYLFDNQDKLFYRGQLDDSRPGNGIPLSGTDLRNAIDALIYNRTLNEIQKPSIGCNIKWK